MNPAAPDKPTWAEVAYAVVEFAREDTRKFLLVAGILAFLWKVLRIRVVLGLQRDYTGRRTPEVRKPSPVENESDD